MWEDRVEQGWQREAGQERVEHTEQISSACCSREGSRGREWLMGNTKFGREPYHRYIIRQSHS
jgi:hypothetical protein